MDSKERINHLLDNLNISPSILAKKLGRTAQSIYDIQRGKVGISKKMAKDIVYYFPNICEYWLLTGEGTMLKDNSNNPTSKQSSEEDSEDWRYAANDPVIHERLLDVINKIGLSARDISLRMGLGLEYIAQIISNREIITIKFLQSFCREYSVSSDFILNGIGKSSAAGIDTKEEIINSYLAQNSKMLAYMESLNTRITNIEEKLSEVKREAV